MSAENRIFDHPDSMDWVVAALASAVEEGLTLEEVYMVAVDAETPEAFDDAVNTVVLAHPNAAREFTPKPNLFDWASI